MKELWINTRSFIYTGLTLGGVLIIFLGSVVILPIIIGIVVALVIFYMCKAYINEKAEYEREKDN